MGMLVNLWPDQPAGPSGVFTAVLRDSPYIEVFYDCVRVFPRGTAVNLPMSGRLGEEVAVNTHLHTLRINLGLCVSTLLTDVCWCDGLGVSFH